MRGREQQLAAQLQADLHFASYCGLTRYYYIEHTHTPTPYSPAFCPIRLLIKWEEEQSLG